MKFVSALPQYFSELPENFSREFPSVNVVQGADLIEKETNPIFVDECMDPKDVVAILCNKSLNHVMQKNSNYFHEDLWHCGQLVVTPERYFSLGAKSLLKASEKSYFFEFSEKADKAKLREGTDHFVAECGSESLLEASRAIIEELYMNAIIDAPKEAANRGIQATSKVNTIELERDSQRLVISCTDPYGALDVAKFLNRMNEVYSKGAGEVINLRGQGGAGLGCVIMFEHSMSMFLGVQKNKCTRVSCVVPIGMNNRQRANVKKSLHRLSL